MPASPMHAADGAAASAEAAANRHDPPPLPGIVPVLVLPPVPVPLSPLIGREPELARITTLLGQDGVRLLTLVGPGGVGKTRLALHLAATATTVLGRPAAFIPLAWITHPELVLPTIGQALGVPEGSQPAAPKQSGQATLAAGLAGWLGERELLLVLDNWEQVLGAGPGLAALLGEAPGLRVLATSRTPLGVYGERVLRIPPLPLPPPLSPPAFSSGAGHAGGGPAGEAVATLLESAAVRLFVARAQAARADFRLSTGNGAEVAEVCRRLDGLPLAIELAAARVRHAPPGSLLARLDRRLPVLTGGPRDQPQRLRTMRDAIAWSHELLSAEERVLFRRLAVFAGGATIEAAEAVCDPELELTLGVWDGISALVDQSLLGQREGEDGEARFELLQTVREFAREQLEAAGEAAVIHDRHADYFLAVVDRFAASMEVPDVYRLLARLQTETNNLRAVLDWYAETGDVVKSLRFVGALAMFWYYQGHLSEGADRIERALADAAGVEVPPLVQAQALVCQGLLAQVRGDSARGLPSLAEGIRLRRLGGDELGAIVAQGFLGGILVSEGRYDEAAPKFDENLTRLRAMKQPIWTAHTLFHLGLIAYAHGERERAVALLAEGAALYDASGSRLDAIDPMRYLGLIALADGDLEGAARLFDENLVRLTERDSVAAFSTGLADIGTLAICRGQAREAAILFGAADAMREANGASFSLPARLDYEAAMVRTGNELGEAAESSAHARGRTLSLQEAIALAKTVLEIETPDDAAPARPESVFTPREHEVLPLLAAGMTNPEIAEHLFIGRGTVRTHVSNILAKLGARTRTEAAALARQQGFIE